MDKGRIDMANMRNHPTKRLDPIFEVFFAKNMPQYHLVSNLKGFEVSKLTPHLKAMPGSPTDVLRNSHSASSLLSGVKHMNADALYPTIKQELPDDPEQLQHLMDVFQKGMNGELDSSVDMDQLKSLMGNCFAATSQHVGQVRRSGTTTSTASTIPATAEELAAAGRVLASKACQALHRNIS